MIEPLRTHGSSIAADNRRCSLALDRCLEGIGEEALVTLPSAVVVFLMGYEPSNS